MALTGPQAAALKAAILADATAAPLAAAGNDPAVAAFYNALASPQVLIWRQSISVVELMNVIDWTSNADGYQTLTLTKQNAYLALTSGGTVDATQANIRAGFGSIFTGPIAAALAAVAQVPATRFQALFVIGGVCSVFGRAVTDVECLQARTS